MKAFTPEVKKKNRADAYATSQKALAYAQRRLREMGIDYPLYDSNVPYEQNHEALRAYAEKEVAFVNEYMQREKAAERPTVNWYV